MSEKKAHLFDYNGTLVDNHGHQHAVIGEFIAEILPGASLYQYPQILDPNILNPTLSSEEVVLKILRILQIQVSNCGLKKYVGLLRKIANEIKPQVVEGATDYIDGLKVEGDIVALVTNTPGRQLGIWMSQVGLQTLIPQEFTFPIDFRGPMLNRKPSPALHKNTLRRLGVSGRNARAYEDNGRGILAAKGAKICQITAINTARFSSIGLIDAGATEVHANFREILEAA